jgi:hypothetical protein
MVMEAMMACSEGKQAERFNGHHALPSWLAKKTWDAFPKRADHRYSWKEKLLIQGLRRRNRLES